MPKLEQYLKNLEASGPELLLEVASEDREVSDAEYADLHRTVLRRPARELPGAQKHWRDMADREYARAELNKDYV